MQKNNKLNFKFIQEIIYHDGPLISLGITEDNLPVLKMWLDVNREEKYNVYAYVFIREEDLLPFVNNEKLYYDVLRDSHKIISWKYGTQMFDSQEMSHEYFLAHYAPTKKDVSLDSDLAEFRPAFYDFLDQEKQKN